MLKMGDRTTSLFVKMMGKLPKPIKNSAVKIINRINWFYKIYIKHDSFLITANRWFKDNGDSTLRVDYQLSENSVVFDVGGYMGKWSLKIVDRYNPYIYIFEPVPEFYSIIVEKFRDNPKVSVYNSGLSNIGMIVKMSVSKDGSSIHREGDNKIDIDLKDIFSFLNKEGINKIDLIKINIEGGEYPLLKRMIETNIIEKCNDIQVQFHNFYPNAIALRNEIRDSLQKTHFLTYDYPFVWENWRKKKN